MKGVIAFFLTFGINAMASEMADYFHRPVSKSCIHPLNGIDFIYVINLDHRPEEFASCTKQLAPYGIHPYRFSAVNGWKLPLEVINDLGVKYESWMSLGQWGTCYPLDWGGQYVHEMMQVVGKSYFCHYMQRGSIGIVLSHLSVLQDAYDSNYETIWVMEDEIKVIQDPIVLSERVAEMDALVGKDGWDILFTDRDARGQDGKYVPCASYAWRPNFIPINSNRFQERMDLSKNLRRIGARYGAYSMIIRRSGMEKLLRFFKNYNIFLPYDMEYTLPNDIRLFTVTNDVVSMQPKGGSENEAQNDGNSELPQGAKQNGSTQQDNVQPLSGYGDGPCDEASSSVKTQAFEFMNQLEGWCSQHKASVLMDLVLQEKLEVVVEIGVFGGKSLIPMACALKANGKGKIFGIDPWDSHASIQGAINEANKSWWEELDHQMILRGLTKKIHQFALTDQIELIQSTSEAAPLIQGIQMLHVDGNHSDETSYLDVTKWVPLMKSGGWIIFDDIDWYENGMNTTSRAIEWLNNNCTKCSEFTDTCTWGIWVKP